MVIIGIYRARAHGKKLTKSRGRVKYYGRQSWYAFYIEGGRFGKRRISPLSIPILRPQVSKLKTYRCPNCGDRFKTTSRDPFCPGCGRPVLT